MTRTAVKKNREPEGLIGFYGHTYDIEESGKKTLQYQFRIVRPMPPARWVVQYFSFWTGEPNKLGVYTEEYLLSDAVALYPDAESWLAAYEKYGRLESSR